MLYYVWNDNETLWLRNKFSEMRVKVVSRRFHTFLETQIRIDGRIAAFLFRQVHSSPR